MLAAPNRGSTACTAQATALDRLGGRPRCQHPPAPTCDFEHVFGGGASAAAGGHAGPGCQAAAHRLDRAGLLLQLLPASGRPVLVAHLRQPEAHQLGVAAGAPHQVRIELRVALGGAATRRGGGGGGGGAASCSRGERRACKESSHEKEAGLRSQGSRGRRGSSRARTWLAQGRGAGRAGAAPPIGMAGRHPGEVSAAARQSSLNLGSFHAVCSPPSRAGVRFGASGLHQSRGAADGAAA